MVFKIDTFKVDNDIKYEYLDEKPSDTAKSDMFVLKIADEYEFSEGKSVYNMSISDLREMIATQFKNTSVKSILKNVSVLKTYIDFCIGKNVVNHGENRLATFTVDEAKEFVSKQALLNKFISREKLEEYKNILYNPQDQLLIELPFIGVRGRTVEDGTLEEIINLTIDDIDEENNRIKLIQNDDKNRIIDVKPSTIELIKDTYTQEFYVENNGEMTNNTRLSEPRKIKINEVEHFVFRVPSKNKFQIFNPNILNSRMRKIQLWLDNKYLTYSSLYFSGMLNLAMDIYKEKNEVTKEDFIAICERYNYGGSDSEKYWYNLKSLFDQYKGLTLK